MNTAYKLLIASASSLVLATAAASSGSGAALSDLHVDSKTPKGHPGHGVTPNNRQAKKFVKGVSVSEITEHQVALQRIASLNDDTREVFSSGYQESLDYVVSTLTCSRLPTTGQPVQLPVLGGVEPARAEQGVADAEDLRPRRRRGQRPADG